MSSQSAPGARPAPPGGGDQPVTQPRLGPIGLARWGWRQLTSMRTALVLLLLVAVAAVPGSIFPQRSVDASRVNDYLVANPTTGPWLDRIGLFDVYSSPWFSAVYLLLMISLIGCVVPRTRLHWHAMRSQPPAAPQRLARLTEHRRVVVPGAPDDVADHLRGRLRRRRYRLRAEPEASRTIAAETGYLRETGNLIFHIALLTLSMALAFGYLFGWRGDKIVPVGSTFGNTPGSYSWSQGPLVNPASLQPFTMRVDDMAVRFEESPGPQFGAARDFRAGLTVVPAPGAAPEQREISVNGPIGLGATSVYLLGNGYAPVITVKNRAGEVLYRDATPFLPMDTLYTSRGAVKVVGAQPQLGFTGTLYPTAIVGADGTPSSAFPDARRPGIVLDVYQGQLFPGGRAQSVYSLETSAMQPVLGDQGKPLRLTLLEGQTASAPDGSWTITFESLPRWAGLSVRHDPAKPYALASGLLMFLGLTASLLVRRRRVFARVSAGPELGTSIVEVGALAKSEDALLGGFVDDLVDGLRERFGTLGFEESDAVATAAGAPEAPGAQTRGKR